MCPSAPGPTLGDRVFVVGGQGSSASEAHDPAANRWSRLAPMSTARDQLAAVALGGRLHAVGGRFNGNFANYGLMLRGPESSLQDGAWLGFSSREEACITYDPYLTIVYGIAAPAVREDAH